jgi:hypothetical protein
MNLRDYLAHDTLKDGTPVTIRAIRRDDRIRLLEAFKNLDRESVYRRFFSPKKELTEAEVEGKNLPAPPPAYLNPDWWAFTIAL